MEDQTIETATSIMPFSGHTTENLQMILLWLGSTPLSVECFDAFLAEYKRSGDLWKAREYAADEWDC